MAGLAPRDTEFFGDDVPEDLRARVKAELEPGERLLWAGRAIQPPVGKTAGTRAAAIWLAGLWSTALVCVAYGHGHMGPVEVMTASVANFLAIVTGVIGAFVAIGLASVVWNRWLQVRKAQHLAYALTDRRAILWRPRPGTRAIEVYTFPGRSLGSLHRVEYADGSGDIEFVGTDSPPWDTRGFFGIAEVRRVEALARSILVDPEARKRRRPDDSDITMLDD